MEAETNEVAEIRVWQIFILQITSFSMSGASSLIQTTTEHILAWGRLNQEMSNDFPDFYSWGRVESHPAANKDILVDLYPSPHPVCNKHNNKKTSPPESQVTVTLY